MSEITATEKKRQPQKWATENWATGKLGNKKWTGRKKGRRKVTPNFPVAQSSVAVFTFYRRLAFRFT